MNHSAILARARTVYWANNETANQRVRNVRGLRTGVAGRNDAKDWALEALLMSGEVINRAADKRTFALYTRNNDTGKLV